MYFLRLNKEPPNIIFKKKEKGGINLQTMCTQSELDNEMVSHLFTTMSMTFIG